MTLLLLVDAERPDCLILQPRRASMRWWTRMHASSLDKALAAGISPDSTAALSLRAAQLINARTRRRLARSLRQVVDDATRPRPFIRGPHVSVCRQKVLASRELLLELVERLGSQEPVDARGVAKTRLLLTGAVDALYDRPRADNLEPALEAALDALELSI